MASNESCEYGESKASDHLLEKQAHPVSSPRKGRSRGLLDVVLACNIAVLLANTCFFIVFYLLISSRQRQEVQLASQDFTKDAIKLELRKLDDVFGPHESQYRGEPRPELDAAWIDLLQGYNLRIPAHIPLQEPTPGHSLVEIPDGSGDHFGVVSVLHELHCLRTMREYLFPDIYPDTAHRLRPEEGKRMSVHMDHCFDMLRQSAMCHADMSLLPMEWWPDQINVPQNVVHVTHKCANWQHLNSWLLDHSFDVASAVELGLLIPPEKVEVFDGHA